MLPKHDAIGAGRRVVEAVAIGMACMLLAVQWVRFFWGPADVAWWTLVWAPLG